MKANFKFIALMMTLCGLASCGGQKASEKELNVSGSFVTAAGVIYNGGLVVKGFKVGGTAADSFIRSVVGSANVKVIIPDGQWDISVVGWTAPGAAGIMDGIPECGRAVVNFDAVTLSANLTINKPNCMGSDFSGPGFVDSAPSIYPLNIVTCGSFYEHTAVDTYAPITPATSLNFCKNANHPIDLKSKVESLRIDFLNKDMGLAPQVASGLSLCIPTSATQGGIFGLGGRFIPVKNLPFKVTLYSQTNCAESSITSDVIVHNGMNAGIVGGDSLLGNNSSNNFFLPTSDTRKAYSPFYNLMPSFKCNGVLCLPNPATAYDHIVQQKLESSVYSVEIEFKKVIASSCVPDANLATSTYSTGWTGAGVTVTSGSAPATSSTLTISQKCFDGEKALVAKFESTAALPLSFTFDYLGEARSVKIFSSGTYREADMLQKTWEILGNKDGRPIGERMNSVKHGDDDKSYGILSLAREMLGPKAIGGLYDKSIACADVVGERTVELFDEGYPETIKTIISNITPYNLPALFGNSGAFSGTQDSQYTKRMVACEVVPGGCIEKIRLDFSCTKKSGRLRDLHSETDDGITRNEIKIVLWNTQSSTKARVEQYSFNQEVDSGNNLVRENNSLNRLVKLSEDQVEINGMSYHYDSNGPHSNGERYFISLYSPTTAANAKIGWDQYGVSSNTGSVFALTVPTSSAPVSATTASCIYPVSLGVASSCGLGASGDPQNQLPVLFSAGLLLSNSDLNAFTIKNVKSLNLYPVVTQPGLFP